MKRTIAIVTILVLVGLFLGQAVFAGTVMDKVAAEKTLVVGVVPKKNEQEYFFVTSLICSHQDQSTIAIGYPRLFQTRLCLSTAEDAL